jgi:hypothetical protein
LAGKINYFRVGAFRSTKFSKSSTKGVTEGSETSIAWGAIFSSRDGAVESIEANKVTIRRDSDGHRYTWAIPADLAILVAAGDHVEVNQVIASTVRSASDHDLACPGTLARNHLQSLFDSRERTQRFTGVKLARLRNDSSFCAAVTELAKDAEEDIYIRLEGLAYLAAVCGRSPEELFTDYLSSPDPQTQLESVIAVGEVGSAAAVDLLSGILDRRDVPSPENPALPKGSGSGLPGDQSRCGLKGDLVSQLFQPLH